MIWLVGSRGMLGSEVSATLAREGASWQGTDRDVDITDPEALSAFASGRKLDWIVNCAAYTAVDKAEDEPDAARSLNADAPGLLGRLARDAGARIIHISTDYVFDGKARRPYDEEASPAPLGVYGRTKLEGEQALRAACPRHFLIRTAWLYGKNGGNFVRTMLRVMKDQEQVRVVADQRGTPTFAVDLAGAISAVIRSGRDDYGVFHYTNEGETTWYDFAIAIRNEARACGVLDHDCRIEPIATDQYPTKARRPAYSVLSRDKIKRVFGLDIPPWRDGLRRYLADS